MKFTKKVLESTVEDKIATACIISTQYLERIQYIYDPEYFKNSFTKRICEWCMEYFKTYAEAPRSKIQDIFDFEKEKKKGGKSSMDPAEADIIETFLARLSKQYELDEQGVNDAYILDKTEKYFKERELELTFTTGLKLLEIGKVEEAENRLNKYKKVQQATSGWFNPFDTENVIEVFDDRNQGILTLPGQLGEMIGPIEREWLISLLGAFKVGKTWLLQDFAIYGLLNRLKVAMISLEMRKKTTNERIYKRITATGDSEKTAFAYPCFDCFLNQTGECNKRERVGRLQLFDENGDKPAFDLNHPYVPCSVCRGTSDYQFATWFEQIQRPKFESRNIIKSLRGFAGMYGDENLRCKSYPRFSASLSDIKRDLDILEYTEGFIPDMIIIDYANILKPERHYDESRYSIDETWKELGGMCAERHCIIVTANQLNRGGLKKRQTEEEDVAEWIGMLGHVDVTLAMSQTPLERDENILRLGLLGHRHKKFSKTETCAVLQQLEVGQTYLDSEIIR